MTCGICSGPLAPPLQGRRAGAGRRRLRAQLPQRQRLRRPLRLRALRDGPAARPPLRRRARTTSTATCATTPTWARRPGAASPPGACSTRSSATPRAGGCSRSAAATGCCSTRRAPAAGASRASSSPPSRASTPARSGSTCATRRWRRPTGVYGAVVLADVLEHLDDPVGALRADRGPARARRRDADRHARSRLAHRPPRRLALVGLPAVAHLPDPPLDAPRAAPRRRAGDRGGAPLLAHVQLRLLDRRAGRALRPGAERGQGGRDGSASRSGR